MKEVQGAGRQYPVMDHARIACTTGAPASEVGNPGTPAQLTPGLPSFTPLHPVSDLACPVPCTADHAARRLALTLPTSCSRAYVDLSGSAGGAARPELSPSDPQQHCHPVSSATHSGQKLQERRHLGSLVHGSVLGTQNLAGHQRSMNTC